MRQEPYVSDVDSLLARVEAAEKENEARRTHKCPSRVRIDKPGWLAFWFAFGLTFGSFATCQSLSSTYIEASPPQPTSVVCWTIKEVAHPTATAVQSWFHVVGETGQCWTTDDYKYWIKNNKCAGNQPKLVWDRAFATKAEAYTWIHSHEGRRVCE